MAVWSLDIDGGFIAVPSVDVINLAQKENIIVVDVEDIDSYGETVLRVSPY